MSLKDKLKQYGQKMMAYSALTAALVGGAMGTSGCSSEKTEDQPGKKEKATYVERKNVKLIGKQEVYAYREGCRITEFYFDSDGDETTAEGVAEKRYNNYSGCLVNNFNQKVGTVKTESEWVKDLNGCGNHGTFIQWVRNAKNDQR